MTFAIKSLSNLIRQIFQCKSTRNSFRRNFSSREKSTVNTSATLSLKLRPKVSEICSAFSFHEKGMTFDNFPLTWRNAAAKMSALARARVLDCISTFAGTRRSCAYITYKSVCVTSLRGFVQHCIRECAHTAKGGGKGVKRKPA